MEVLKPRYYQSEAKAALYKELKHTKNHTVVEIPTGGGKSFVMADIAKDMLGWNRRVLILAHVKELLEQNSAAVAKLSPDANITLYSAGLGVKDYSGDVVVAGIQSIYKQAYRMDPYDVVLIDECHLCPADGEGMYREFIADLEVVNPNIRIVGFSATPYRLDSGYVFGQGKIFDTRCYSVSVAELIAKGYLCRVISKGGATKGNLSKLRKNHNGDYTVKSQEEAFNDDYIVKAACAETVEYMHNRKRVMLYCSSVAHAKHVCQVMLEEHGQRFDLVTGESPAGWRREIVSKFRNNPTGKLCNVGVFTTGLDVPDIDLIAVYRATESPGLWQQIVGRGLRMAEGKENCLILDYGKNILKHGPIDKVKVNERNGMRGDGKTPVKECPECHSIISVGYSECPDCGYKFEKDSIRHKSYASSKSLLSQEPDIYEVVSTNYYVHSKRSDPDGKKTMRVEYTVNDGGETLIMPIREWVCIEHSGFAMQKAHAWWNCRTADKMPDTAQEAVSMGTAGLLREPCRIHVIKDGKYDRIIKAELVVNTPENIDDVPEYVPANDEIPF